MVITLLFLILAIAAEYKTFTLRNKGKITATGVEIYTSSDRTQILTEIDWDTMRPGTNKSETAYLYNNGTTSITLSLQYGQWTPLEAQPYFLFTWTHQNQTIIPSGMLEPVTFNLAVSAGIENITNFTFTALITAEAI